MQGTAGKHSAFSAAERRARNNGGSKKVYYKISY
jgi:hypothetical protein